MKRKIITRYFCCGDPDEEMGLTSMVTQWEEKDRVLVKVGGSRGDPKDWYKCVEITQGKHQELFAGKGTVHSEKGLQTRLNKREERVTAALKTNRYAVDRELFIHYRKQGLSNQAIARVSGIQAWVLKGLSK